VPPLFLVTTLKILLCVILFGAPVVSLRSLLQFYLLWLTKLMVNAPGKQLNLHLRPKQP